MSFGVIEIQDEVNIRFRGVPKYLIEKAQKNVTWHVPGFPHMPAYRAGRWDGTVSLLSTTGKTFLNLHDRVLEVFEEAGYEFDVEDHRHDWSEVVEQMELPGADLFSEYSWPNGDPVMLRDYQLNAVHAAIENGQGLLEMATGAGKTLTCAAISKTYSAHGKVVLIVPNIDLAIQTQALFKMLGLDPGIWYGEMKDARDITITTWQSLDHFPELMADVVCVIVDEAHQAKSKILSDIMMGPAANVPFRFGCTGTVPKEDLPRNQIIAVIGNVIFQLKAWELQQKGVLASSEVFQLVMQDSKNPRYQMASSFEEWSEQLDWIFSDPARLDYMTSMIKEIAREEGNVLILVPYRKHGKALEERIEGSVSLDGKDRPTKRREKYEWFNENDNNVLICTFGIASTGLDIPRIKVLCFIEPGKKFEKVIQTVGRGLRKASDKNHVMILDIVGDTVFSKSHASERRRLYKEAKIEVTREEIDYAGTQQ